MARQSFIPLLYENPPISGPNPKAKPMCHVLYSTSLFSLLLSFVACWNFHDSYFQEFSISFIGVSFFINSTMLKSNLIILNMLKNELYI